MKDSTVLFLFSILFFLLTIILGFTSAPWLSLAGLCIVGLFSMAMSFVYIYNGE